MVAGEINYILGNDVNGNDASNLPCIDALSVDPEVHPYPCLRLLNRHHLRTYGATMMNYLCEASTTIRTDEVLLKMYTVNTVYRRNYFVFQQHTADLLHQTRNISPSIRGNENTSIKHLLSVKP